MLPGALSDPPGTQSCPLRGTICLSFSLTCYSSKAAVQDHTMQLAITQMESTDLMSHKTTNNWARDLRLKLLMCIGIARHHGLTPRDFTNSTSCLLFPPNHPNITSAHKSYLTSSAMPSTSELYHSPSISKTEACY